MYHAECCQTASYSLNKNFQLFKLTIDLAERRRPGKVYLIGNCSIITSSTSLTVLSWKLPLGAQAFFLLPPASPRIPHLWPRRAKSGLLVRMETQSSDA